MAITDPKWLPKQKRLFTEMMLLIEDEEILNMLEKLIEEEGLLLDTPMIRRLRQQGFEEGKLDNSRHMILKTVDLRFDPTVSVHQKLSERLGRIAKGNLLDNLFTTALQCQTIADFQTALESANQQHK